MVDVRRAYGRWLKRRLLWLAPSFLLSCAICLNLASERGIPGWIRIPSLALAVGVAVLFGLLVAQTLLVAREKSRGKSRRAQALRTELRPYAGVGLASLVLLLILLAVPAMLPEPLPVAVPAIHRPTSAVDAKQPAVPSTKEVGVSPAVPPVESVQAAATPAPSDVRPPEPPGVPQIVPEIARLPDLPYLWAEVEPPARPPGQEKGDAGTDRYGMKHRPGPDDDIYVASGNRGIAFDRAGLPAESDDESWIPPTLQVEVMLVARSGPWRGAAVETEFDMPFGRFDSLRLTYSDMLLSDDPEFDGIEPSFSWHRGTMEYVRRIFGYTRQSTFDFAFRIGLAADRLSTHEARVQFNSSFRLSPWFGIESAVWEDDRVGLVLQAGHSPATRLGNASAKVTDLRVLVRIDLGENSSVELGYRIVSVRFRDQAGAEDEYADKMNRSFTGPIAGFVFRF